jgi:hypothetical protein
MSPVFSGVHVARSLVFYVMFCRSFVCPFVLLPLAIVFSILLRFTASDYPFGIFKLTLEENGTAYSSGAHDFMQPHPRLFVGVAVALFLVFSVLLCLFCLSSFRVLCSMSFPSLDCPFLIPLFGNL